MRRAALSSPFLCRVIIPASSFQTHYFYHTTSCTTSGGSSDSGPYQIWLGFVPHNELAHRPLSFCCGSTQNFMFILHLLTLMSCKTHTTFFVPWKATGNMHPGFLDHFLSPGHALCLLVYRGRPEWKLDPWHRHRWKPLSGERCHWGEWQIHSSILSQLTGIHPSQIKAFRSSIVCYIISFFRPQRRTVTNNSWFVLFYYVMLWTTWIRALLQMGNIYIKTIIFVQLASMAQPSLIRATTYLALFCFLILVSFPPSKTRIDLC